MSDVQPASMPTPVIETAAARTYYTNNKTEELSVTEQILRARETIKRYPGRRRKIYFFVGISKYSSLQINNLRFADKDVRDMSEHYSYNNEDVVFILTNENATKANIEKIFDFLAGNTIIGHDAAANCKPEDYFYLHWSGHGFKERIQNKNEDKTKKVYLVPHDADEGNFNTYISMEYLSKKFCDIPAIKPITLDTCFSGRMFGKQPRSVRKEGDPKGQGKTVGSRTAPDTGRVVTLKEILEAFRKDFKRGYIQSAATGAEVAFEFGEIEHGALTYAIMFGLGKKDTIGLADLNGNDVISDRELALYLKRSVPRLVDIVVISRYVPDSNGITSIERLCSVYTPDEMQTARERAAEFHYFIPEEVKDFTLTDIWLISMIIEPNSKFSEKIRSRFSKDEIKDAYALAEQEDIKIQTPMDFDCYPSFENKDEMDMVIKAAYGLDQFEVQEDKDKYMRIKK